MSREQRRERERITRTLQRDIAKNGIESLLTRLFGTNTWTYDKQENLWIVPDRHDSGPGRAYYCIPADGSWFKARLEQEHTQ
jgi:hypothetical protein